MADTLGTLVVRIAADIKDLQAGLKNAQGLMRNSETATNSLATATDTLTRVYRDLAVAATAWKAYEYVKDAAMLAARYETLGVSMKVVGQNAGYNAAQMESAAQGMQSMGLSMMESRQQAMRLVQAHINLADSQKLTRIAQDAAVIGNMNSSEAFATMIHGIQSGQTDVLRNIGLNVSMEQSYKIMAGTLHKNADALTRNEKTQGVLNAVMLEGAGIAGTYEAAMDTAGKQINSMTRYTEDLKVLQGSVFNEILTVAVMGYTEHLKESNAEMRAMAANGELKAWGMELASIFVGIANSIDNVMTMAKMGGTWLAQRNVASDITAKYQTQIDTIPNGADFNDAAKRAALVRQRDAEIKSTMQLLDESQVELAGRTDRFERSWEVRQAANAASASKIVGDLAATEKFRTQTMAFWQAERQAGRLKEQDYIKAMNQFLITNYGDNHKYVDEASTGKNDATKKAAREYASATKAASEYILKLKEEAQEAGLSAEQIKMLSAARIAAKAPTAALRLEIMEQAVATGLAISAAKEAEAATTALTAANAALRDSELKRVEVLEKSLGSMAGSNAALAQEIALIGKSEAAQYDIVRARQEDVIATKEQALAKMQHAEYMGREQIALEEEIRLLKERQGLQGKKFEATTAAKLVDDQLKSQVHMWKQVDSVAHDTFVSIFDSGKNAFDRLKDTLKNGLYSLLYQMTVKKWLINVVASSSGAGVAQQAFGSDGNSLVGLAGTASNLSSAYSMGSTLAVGGQYLAGTMSGLNAVGTIAANATGTGISGLLATNGAYGTAAAGSGSAIAGGATSALAAIPVWGWAALAAVAVAGMFGGRGDKEATGGGIEGQFGSGGFNGNTFSTWKQDGGWFHNDRTGKETGGLDAATATQFTRGYGTVQLAAAKAAVSLGLSTDAIVNFSEAVSIQLTSDAAANEKAINKTFGDLGDHMASAVAPGLLVLAKEGETAGATLARLSGSLISANAWLSMLRQRLFQVSMAGGDAASKLADAFGGLENLNSASQAFYETYYTEGERAARSQEDMAKALALVNLAMPTTKDGLRELAGTLDLNTESGRAAYAMLLAIAPEFATTADSIAKLAKEQADAAIKAAQDSARAAQDMADKLLATFTGGGLLVPALDLAGSSLDTLAGNAGTLQGGLSSINAIMGDAGSGVLTFGTYINDTITPLSSAQLAAAGLTAQIDQLRSNATGANIDLVGLNVALANVNTETFLATMQGVFVNLADRLKTVLASIGDERIAVREAALQILNPAALGYAGIQTGITAAKVGAAPDAAYYEQMALNARAAAYYANSLVDAWQNYIDYAEAGGKIYASSIDLLYAKMDEFKADKTAANATLANTSAAYAAAMQQYAGDSEKATVQLGRMREATVKYFESQKALAELMTASAANLRKSTGDYRFSQLTDTQKVSALATQFSSAYTAAQSAQLDGATLAGYGDKLNSLLGPLIDSLNTTGQSNLINSYLAQTDVIAGLIEQSTPVNYQQESIGLLNSIDLTLDEMATAASIIKGAVDAGSGLTASGLRAIVQQLGGTPAFASGGGHAGGLRKVGENGPEWEVTGPSLIFNASQTRSRALGGGAGGNAELVSEIRALRAEVAGLRSEARATAVSTNKTTRILDRAISTGNGALAVTVVT